MIFAQKQVLSSKKRFLAITHMIGGLRDRLIARHRVARLTVTAISRVTLQSDAARLTLALAASYSDCPIITDAAVSIVPY